MHGIVSLLNSPAYEQVEAIWQELEDVCGLSGIRMTPLAHFSWQVAEKYEFEQTHEILKRISDTTCPFPVSASGLGIFTGQAPVLYIPLAKDENLLRFHASLWEETHSVVDGPSEFYSPRLWIPHITLAYGDVDAGKLTCALQLLAFKSFDLSILVDNLALVYQSDGEEGYLKYRYDFRG
jgi:2'-5' RNA ligase